MSPESRREIRFSFAPLLKYSRKQAVFPGQPSEGCVPPRAVAYRVAHHRRLKKVFFQPKVYSSQNGRDEGVPPTSNDSPNAHVSHCSSKEDGRIQAAPDPDRTRIFPGNSSEILCPFCVKYITRFTPSELGRKQVINRRNNHLQQTIPLACGARLPTLIHFPQDSRRHQIDMPSVLLLELAADHGLIAKNRYRIALCHRINIHAVFRKCGIQAHLRGMPKQTARTYQSHGGRLGYFYTPVREPLLYLVRVLQFSARHGMENSSTNWRSVAAAEGKLPPLVSRFVFRGTRANLCLSFRHSSCPRGRRREPRRVSQLTAS